MKRYAEYKNSGIEWIDTIPSEWDIVKNKRAFKLSKNIVGDCYESYHLLSLTKRGIVYKNINSTDGKLPESWTTYQSVEQNDIVLCLFDLDCSAVFSDVSEFDGMISPAYKIYKCTNKILPCYAKYWFHNISFDRKYKMYSKSLRYVVNAGDFKEIFVALPSITQQEKISIYLNKKCLRIDSMISNKQLLMENLKEYKHTLITESVTKGLHKSVLIKESGYDWIGKIPAHWQVKKLRYLGTCQNGLSKAGEFFGSGYPFVSYGDVYKNIELPQYIEGLVESTDLERENCSVLKGDVFFTRTSETVEEIAITSTCLHTIENATFAGFLIRFRANINDLNPNYSKYYFRNQLNRAYFVKEMNLVTRASLSQELLKNLPVLLPPMNEQEEIAEYLDGKIANINYLITDITEQIEKLKEYRQSVISEAVTGKVMVE